MASVPSGVELQRRLRALAHEQWNCSCSGGTTLPMAWAAAPRPLDVDIFRPPMLRNSYGKLSGGSRSKTSRLIASDRSREPPAVARSLPLGLWSPRTGSTAQPTRGSTAASRPLRTARCVRSSHSPRPTGPGRPDRRPPPSRRPSRTRSRRPDLAASRADDPERQPVVGMLDVGDTTVNTSGYGETWARSMAALIRVVGGSDLPCRVDVAHPVVAIRVDAKAGEHVDEGLGVVACV